MWDQVSDLSDLGDWLVMHEGWRSELPDELSEGTQVVGVARAKGFRNRVTWTVTKWDPPHELAMSGSGQRRGQIRRHAHRATGRCGIDAGRTPGAGRTGAVRSGGFGGGRAVKGDVQKSLRQFVELYG